MGMIEDILKALDRVPNWKRISGTPSEIDALTRRVAALEARLNPTTGDQCPSCRVMAYRLVSSQRDPGPFGELGAMQDTHACSACGYKRIHNRDPG